MCPAVMIPLGGPVTDRIMAEKSAKQRVEKIARRHLHGVRYEPLITTGDVAERVTNFQSALSIDLIVMGTHGRRAVPRFFFGSVAARVVREAASPVLTVR